MSDFGRRIIVDAAFEATLRAAVASVHAAGCETTVLDAQRMIAEELRGDCRRYALVTATNPSLLARAIALDLDAAVAVPCHFAVYELADGRTAIAAGEPMAEVLYSPSWQRENPALAQVAVELGEQVGHVLAGIELAMTRPAAA